MTVIGYLRIAAASEDDRPQKTALLEAGCTEIFEDVGGVGARGARPKLGQALTALRQGDILVIKRLDRVGRTLQHLVSTLIQIQNRGVGFRSLDDNIDTTRPITRACTALWLKALGRFETDAVRERTRVGLAVAAAHGRKPGRPRVLSPAKLERAVKLLDGKDLSTAEVAHIVKVSRSALYAAIAELRDHTAPAAATRGQVKRHG